MDKLAQPLECLLSRVRPYATASNRRSRTAPWCFGTDKSRGYCLEMISADFLAGANLENENPEVLLQSVLRFFKFLPGEERKIFFDHVAEEPSSI